MSLVSGFAPLASRQARVLVLGSMPGVQSLIAQQYYAHPRNAFWLIMSDLLGVDRASPYRQRLEYLSARGVALWDVLAHCQRSGSLDSAIRAEELQANDFRQFLAEHRHLRVIFFNGTKSEQLWQRHVMPSLAATASALSFMRLPSTSPAFASMRYEQKLQSWSVLLDYLGDDQLAD